MGTWFRFQVLLAVVSFVRAIPIDNDLDLKPRPSVPVEKTICDEAGAGDFIVIVDGSTSIGIDNFKILRNWLADIVLRLPDSARYGLIEFTGMPVKMFDLGAFEDKDQVAKELRNLRYITGTTKLAEALQFMLDEQFLEASTGNRPEVPDTIVIITDGRSSDDPVPVADVIRGRSGIKELQVIGLTDAIDADQLNLVAAGRLPGEGEENFFTYIEDFSLLTQDAINSLISKAQSCRTEIVLEPAGPPTLELECTPAGIRVGADTRNPFDGRVYVKGFESDPDCVNVGDGTTSRAEFNLDVNSCGTIRRRSAEPQGIFIENTVVFSFHPKFVTKVDKVFRVQCFFMEADKPVEQNLIVGPLTTSRVTDIFEMPVCQYTLHRDSPDGPEVRFALVGDKIVHKWQCDNSNSEDLFKMRVYDCYVENGDQRIALLDNDGCSIDRFLLGNLDYATDHPMLAYVESHAFKFPDQTGLYFQCQIELCVGLENGCQNTPPVCGEGTRSAVASAAANVDADALSAPAEPDANVPPLAGGQRKRRATNPGEQLVSIDVFTPFIQLAEPFYLDWNETADEPKPTGSVVRPAESGCAVSTRHPVLFTIGLLALLMSGATVLAAIWLRSRRGKQ